MDKTVSKIPEKEVISCQLDSVSTNRSQLVGVLQCFRLLLDFLLLRNETGLS